MPGINTTKQQVTSVQNACKVRLWPIEAGDPSEADLEMFKALQQQRSFDDWSPIDLVELARVAAFQVDAVNQQRKLRSEGHVIFGGKSGLTPLENSRGRVLNTLNSTINASLRRLGITVMSVGEKRTQAARGRQERNARSVLELDSGDNSFDGSDLMN